MRKLILETIGMLIITIMLSHTVTGIIKEAGIIFLF
jgi:hypothetical protein